MNPSRSLSILGAAGLAGAAAIQAAPPFVPAGEAAKLFPPPGNELPAKLPPPDPATYAPLLELVTPAVVSVFPVLQLAPDADDPLDRFFGRGREVGDAGQRIQGVGSGVVISPEGWIITNSHVVHLASGKLADAISVEFPDFKRRNATIVGVDPATDLALLKVDGPTPDYLGFADSDLVRSGDLVFAIGNPFRVGTTATMGMVSATGRSNLGLNGKSGFESFIQTDAAINPGNSGGALIDTRGRLIGVNTAIWSKGGGNIGLGFAIPSRLVRHVAIRLAEEGKVRRGFFGWSLAEVTQADATRCGMADVRGALVAEVMKDGPAGGVGLLAGDVILEASNRPVNSVGDLRYEMSMIEPGEKLAIMFRRASGSIRLDLTGIEPAEVPRDEEFGIPALPGVRFRIDGESITVVSVDEESAPAGLVAGMEITAVNDLVVSTHETLEEAFRRGVNKVAIRLNGAERTLAIRAE